MRLRSTLLPRKIQARLRGFLARKELLAHEGCLGSPSSTSVASAALIETCTLIEQLFAEHDKQVACFARHREELCKAQQKFRPLPVEAVKRDPFLRSFLLHLEERLNLRKVEMATGFWRIQESLALLSNMGAPAAQTDRYSAKTRSVSKRFNHIHKMSEARPSTEKKRPHAQTAKSR